MLAYWSRVRYIIYSSPGQTKDNKIGICCFSTKHAALRRKNKNWLVQNQDNVSRVEQHVYPLTVVSVSHNYKISTKRVGLVQSISISYPIQLVLAMI